jgi:hypothetical protein
METTMVTQEASTFELGLTEDYIKRTSWPLHCGHLIGNAEGASEVEDKQSSKRTNQIET